MIFNIILVLVGFALLMFGGDKLVEGASALARKFNLSDIFIGIAVVGFGTSLPEMMAMGTAMLNGSPDLALGNILGSNVANVGLVLGVGLLMTSTASGLRQSRADYFLMLGALFLFALLFALDALSFVGGLILFAGLALYLFTSLKMISKKPAEEPEAQSESTTETPLWKSSLLVIFGLACLVFGANWLISGASAIALTLGVSERVIGITLVAVGTSLPELGAVIAAARQSKLGMVAGNIMGSNAFNALAGGGVSALLGSVPVAAFKLDIIFMFVFMALMAPLFFLGRRPYKLLGATLIILYTIYIILFVI